MKNLTNLNAVPVPFAMIIAKAPHVLHTTLLDKFQAGLLTLLLL
jgi:hypothetical protein